jgi:hypothetical protein
LRNYVVLSVLFAAVLLAGLAWRYQLSSRTAKQPSAPTITKEPPQVALHTFDPAAPPPGMPPLTAGEAAVCDSNFVSHASVKGQPERIDPTHAVATVTEVKVTLQLTIHIWVPVGATEHVIEHEQGHRQISEHYYKGADKVAEQIAAAYLGKTVSVSGTDLGAEVEELLKKMGADITAEYNDRLNPGPAQQRYDQITDHSRNEVGASEAVDRALSGIAVARLVIEPAGGQASRGKSAI